MKDKRFEKIKQALKSNENVVEALALTKTLNSKDLKGIRVEDFQELYFLTWSAQLKASENTGIRRILILRSL